MKETLVPDMVRDGIRPLREALERPGVVTQPGNAGWLLNACLFTARMVELLWEDDLHLVEQGLERKTALAYLRESADVIDLCLALESRFHRLVADPESALKVPPEELETLAARLEHITAIRAQLGEVIGWLEAPRPPIDPSAIPIEGVTFMPFEKLRESLNAQRVAVKNSFAASLSPSDPR